MEGTLNSEYWKGSFKSRKKWGIVEKKEKPGVDETTTQREKPYMFLLKRESFFSVSHSYTALLAYDILLYSNMNNIHWNT